MATACYARISLDPLGERAGVGRQLEDCRALCERQGWAPAVEFEDNDASASRYARKRRPAYRRLLAAIRSGEVDRVVTWATDRLYRQPIELEELLTFAETGRVEIVCVTSGALDLSTSGGRFTARNLVNAAAYESDIKSDRIKRQKRQAREQGRPQGAPRAFGWRDGRTPAPVEAPLVLAAFEAVIAGRSVAGIARGWNAAGIRRKGGQSPWNAASVLYVLTNARHAGLISHHGEIIREARWAPIVSRETFEEVQSILEARAGHHGPRRRSAFTGVFRCGACGWALTRGGYRRHASWRCCAGAGRAACGRVSISAAPVEQYVTEALFAYLDTATLAEAVAGSGATDTTAALTLELATLARRLDDMAEAHAAGRLSLSAYERAAARVEAQQQTVRDRIGQLATVRVVVPFAGKAGALRDTWPTLADDQRRELFLAFATVVIHPHSRPGNRTDLARVEFRRAA